MTEPVKRRLSTLALFVTSIIWGSSFFVVKNAVDTFPPAYLLAIRFTCGSVLLTLIFHRRLKGATKKTWRNGAIIGVFLFLASYVQTLGITDTTPGKNAFLSAVYCVLVPFFFWIAGRKRPPIKSFLMAILCFIGVGVVSLDDNLTIRFGDLVTLLSGALFAAHIVAIALLGRDSDPVALTVIQFMTVAALCWGTGLLTEQFPARVDAATWRSIAYLVIMPTSTGFLLQTVGQRHAPPDAAAIIMSLESVFGVVFSVLFYGEVLTARIAVGFVIILVAVVMTETDFRKVFKAKNQIAG